MQRLFACAKKHHLLVNGQNWVIAMYQEWIMGSGVGFDNMDMYIFQTKYNKKSRE